MVVDQTERRSRRPDIAQRWPAGPAGRPSGTSGPRVAFLAAVLAIPALFASPALATPTPKSKSCQGLDRVYASELVDSTLLNGPWHKVAPCARIHGHLARFELDTSFGPLRADGVEMLAVRVEEMAAVNALEELGHAEAFAGAMAAGVELRYRRLGRIAMNPIDTVKGVPDGVLRYLSHSYQDAKDTAQRGTDRIAHNVTEEGDPYRSAAPPIAPDTAKLPPSWYARGAASLERAGLGWLGYYKTRRALAERVGVDPYSTNPLLKERLDSLAWAALSGDKALGLALDLLGTSAGEVLSASKRVDGTVWQLDPSELSRRNRARLAGYDCPDEEVRGFLARGKFSPTLETAFVDAYVALAPAEGCADLLLLASYARNEIEARYLVNLLSLLVAERRGEAGGRIVLIGTGVALDIGTTRRHELLLPLPVDRLGWNEASARFFAASEFAITDKTVLVAGGTTLPAARALARNGWSVIEHVRYEGGPAYAWR